MSRSHVSRRVAIAFVASATAAVSLAGCGGSSKASTSAAAQPGGGSTAKAATKAGSGGSSGDTTGSVNICSLLPAATLSQITGKQFTMTEEDNTPSYKLSACNYTNTASLQGINQLRIDIIGKGGAVGLSADLDAAKQVKSSLVALHPVSGIGDKAYGGGIQAQLEVLYGDTLIKISGGTDITEAQCKQIVSQLHSKL